jgi:hypothetical protein
MQLRFCLDPVTGEPHIYNHDVDEIEVQDILEMPGEDRPGYEGTRVAIGQTPAGRYLRVIYKRDDSRDGILVITANDLRGKALRAYRRRRKRKQQ